MKYRRPLCILCWIAGASLAALLLLAGRLDSARGAEAETLPEGLEVVALEATPAAIELSHKFDYRQVLITGKLSSGETVDLTRMAELASASPLVSVSAERLVRPAADGEGKLAFAFRGLSAEIPLKVSGHGQSRPVSFIRDVQPVFSRMSCNAGTCHGSKDGKNGFKLSLRGYDAEFDYRAFTDDVAARRFNRAAPDQSLMLLKATGSIPHVGGVRTEVGSPYYELLRQWIADGVKFDRDSARVARIEVTPRNVLVPRPGMNQQMIVTAFYTDGSQRDVTREAFVESGNIEVIEAGQHGLLHMLRRGEASVLVRYEGAYAATTLTVMGDRSGFVWSDPPTYNYIDELIYKKLARVKILPSDVCTDEEFVRRLYIDLTGMPPTADQTRAFLNSPGDSRARRAALVDALVGSGEFVEHWTNKWADLLQVNRKFLGEEGALALRNWIKQCVASNMPYDEFARQVLTASGSNMENPPAAYYKILRDPAAAMENTTHLFLAVRFNCNKCHDHPFERWTQDQYYHLAAYFAQVGRKGDPSFAGQNIGGSAVEGATPLVEVVYDTGAGEVTHDRTGQVSPPAFPYQHGDMPAGDLPRREQLARWIASRNNQYFASSFVNRLWGYLFGVGIIEPIDDIRAGNPPTNPELLAALTSDFVESGFDVQHILKTICNSRTYQHSVATNDWNADDQINYSHALPRRLPAEVLFDAIHVASGAVPKLPGAPAGFRAAQLPDAGATIPFLDDFGRPVRESSCECERSSSMVLGPIMKLVNGPTVADAIGDPQNALAKLAAEQPDDARLIEEVFLRFLSRKPTEQEIALGKDALAAPGKDYESAAAALAKYEQESLPEKLAAWEKSLAAGVSWIPLAPSEMISLVGATFTRNDDGSISVGGAAGKDVYTITASTDLKDITAIRLEALADPALPAGGPGRAPNGNFVLSELSMASAPKSDPSQFAPVTFSGAVADFSQESWAAAGAIDGGDGGGWAVAPQFGVNHVAVFETRENVGHEGGSVLSFKLSQQFPDGLHSLGRFRLSVTSSPRPVGLEKIPEELAKLLAVPADQRTAEQRKELLARYMATDPELARLTQAFQQAELERNNRRLIGVQDLAWALINTPAFLFNR